METGPKTLKICTGYDERGHRRCSVYGNVDFGTFMIKWRNGGTGYAGTAEKLVEILAEEGVASLKFCFSDEVVRVDPNATNAERDALISSIAVAFMSTPIRTF